MIDYSFATERLKNRLDPKGQGNPPASFQASQIGRPCSRYLYFTRVPEAWALRKPFGAAAQYEMNRGSERESLILEKAVDLLAPDFQDWIFQRLGPYGRMGDPRLQCYDQALDIRGRIDALCTHKSTGKTVAVEVKTMSVHTWERINRAEDFRDAADHYLNGYYGQLQAYLYNFGLEDGLFILEAKERASNGDLPLKFLPVVLDFEYFQAVIDRIKLAQFALRAGKPPDPIAYTEKGCGRCPYLTVCGNSPSTNGTAAMYDADLLEKLNRREELKADSSEYEKLDSEIKERLKGVGKAVIGNFYVTGEKRTRQMKATEARTQEFWQTKIENMAAKENERQFD